MISQMLPLFKSIIVVLPSLHTADADCTLIMRLKNCDFLKSFAANAFATEFALQLSCTGLSQTGR